MSKITKALHYQKTDGTSGSCTLYTSKSDCAGYSVLNLEVDSTTVYAGLGTSLTANNASGIRVQKNGSDTKYAVLKWTQATMNITQVSNQTITVKNSSGTSISSGTLLPMNTALTITCTPATGYNTSSITVNGTTVTSPYTITQANVEAGSLTISASAATKKTFTFTITQSEHQTITVTCNGKSYTSSFTASYGDTWTAKVVADTNYDAGTLSASSGTVTGAVSISATAATLAVATVTIVQTTGQTIHVYTPQKEGGTDHTSTFTIPVNTTFEAEVVGNTGVLPGDLSTK